MSFPSLFPFVKSFLYIAHPVLLSHPPFTAPVIATSLLSLFINQTWSVNEQQRCENRASLVPPWWGSVPYTHCYICLSSRGRCGTGCAPDEGTARLCRGTSITLPERHCGRGFPTKSTVHSEGREKDILYICKDSLPL